MTVTCKVFGKIDHGHEAELYTLTNGNGLTAKISTFGAILVALEVPDRNGSPADIVLGYDTLAQYFNDPQYFGATVGRYADRIYRGRFVLDGIEYRLAANCDSDHIHGGVKGFNKVIWNGRTNESEQKSSVELSYFSCDTEEGYPGNLNCSVTYTLTEQNELSITYQAQTDKPTPINLTNHSYFNLTGGVRDVFEHELTINAERYAIVDKELIPTGEFAGVKNTPLDFTQPTAIGARVDQLPDGYDHSYVLNRSDEPMAFAARVYEPTSGRVMEIFTTQPAIQLYTAYYLDPSLKGKGGCVYQKQFGLCLETQHFADSPNQPNFPSTILKPGQKFHHRTIHKFTTF